MGHPSELVGILPDLGSVVGNLPLSFRLFFQVELAQVTACPEMYISI